LKVALNTSQLSQPVPGGIGRYVAGLRDRLPRAGVDVVAFGPRARHALTYERWHRLPVPVRLPAGVDVVHAPSLAIPPVGRRPLVVTVHDLVFELQPEFLTPRGVRFHRRGLARAQRRATAIIVPSRYVADLLVERGFAPATVHVIHHGVDAGADRPALEIDRALGRLGVAEPFVLTVGTVEPRKGFDVLAAAMRDVDADLVIAGAAGWGRTVPLGRARLLGHVSDDDLDALYRRATLLAFPTRGEGFGLPVVEAMVRGCPVVASDVASIPEVAGGAALLVPPGDARALAAAITTLLADDAVRRDLAGRGRARAAAFSWDACITAHRQVYEHTAHS